ncbi:MAG: transglycosylase SLT domain-containing protein [Candidatus Thiosymbion ectosymbiont of Robbea hypermnestra]|nr:transglycosylase SLT domain-containing protein [Candidatus Thiosymbion ectosymbiont of Robbea hypermnestra]
MQTRRAVTAALPILLLALLVLPGTFAGPPSFEQIRASDDGKELTAWGRRSIQGTTKDHPQAVKLFCRAACRGDVDAKFELGRLYTFGEGVRRDWGRAAAWHREAVEGGHPEAQGMLAVLGMQDENVAACPLYVPGGSYPGFEKVARRVQTMAPDYRLAPDLVLALIEAESRFDPQARSPKGALGLMQLMPGTVKLCDIKIENALKPQQNLKCGMTYLRRLIDRFKRVDWALAAYNAGPGKVRQHKGIPPIRQTQKYVERILERIGWDCPYAVSRYIR